MNPTDAFRKEQRKREIARNKLERKLQRNANRARDNPENIKDELAQIVDKEENVGTLSKSDKLHKRILQDAYNIALKRKEVYITLCMWSI